VCFGGRTDDLGRTRADLHTLLVTVKNCDVPDWQCHFIRLKKRYRIEGKESSMVLKNDTERTAESVHRQQ
jgi:hypothetical protein